MDTPSDSDFGFIDSGYGKNYIKLLHVKRDGPTHHIKEFSVNTQLTLDSKKDYLYGDNSDIVATDSQKNTVYILAQQHGVRSPEEFGLLLCSHFLSKYPKVTLARICIEEHPWQRLTSINGIPHNHAFISTPNAIRFCCISFARGGLPAIESGFRNLKVMKTTQSAFQNFIHDEFTTLPDTKDRIFSTTVYAKWQYNSTLDLEYNEAWQVVRSIILETFAGDPITGIFSPSVQNTLYLAQKSVLEKVPQMSQIEVQLPNNHYNTIDFSKFSKMQVGAEQNDVFIPISHPAGNMYAILGRRKSILPNKAMKAKL